MKKIRIVLGAVLAIFLMTMLPSISAVEYKSVETATEEAYIEYFENMNPEELKEMIISLDLADEILKLTDEDIKQSGIVCRLINIIVRIIKTIVRLTILIPLKIVKMIIKLLIKAVKIICLIVSIPFRLILWILDVVLPGPIFGIIRSIIF